MSEYNDEPRMTSNPHADGGPNNPWIVPSAEGTIRTGAEPYDAIARKRAEFAAEQEKQIFDRDGKGNVRQIDAEAFVEGIMPKKFDDVEKPSHYNQGQIEVWDFIIDQGLNYCSGNIVKYVCRAGKKDSTKHVQDLEKAKAYLEREIRRVKNEQGH